MSTSTTTTPTAQQIQDFKQSLQDLYALGCCVRDAGECACTGRVPRQNGNYVKTVDMKNDFPGVMTDTQIQSDQQTTILNVISLITSKLADVKAKGSVVLGVTIP